MNTRTGQVKIWFLVLLLVVFTAGCKKSGSSADEVVSDTIAPTVTFTLPVYNATGVAINTKINATFSEEMDPLTITNVNFTLKQTVSGVAMEGAVSYTGVSAVFTPTNVLSAGTSYTATITGVVRDLAGNTLGENYTINFTTGVAADTTAPTVTGTINANGAINVAVNTHVGALFSEGMDPTTITSANFTLKESVSNAAVAGVVTYAGVSAVFTPTSDLANSTGYTVTIKGGAGGVKDLAGNALASDFVISWTTGALADTTAPTVTGTIHANGATNVAINTQVGATFSEGMDPLTVTNVNFLLKETVSGAAVAGTVSYAGVSAVFTPTSNLANSTGYTVTVKGGPNGVKDLAGNALASDFMISWTTGAAPDTVAPTVTGTINADGATNVSVNTQVGATFSEGMDPLTITNVNFTMKRTVSGAAVAGTVSYSGVNAVFIPAGNFANSTVYTVTIKGGVNGVKDLAGNALANDYVWSWTTSAAADTTAPTIIGTINANGATNVAINTQVGATFSEGMDPLTITNVNFTLKETVSNAAISGVVSYSGVNAVFIPTSGLSSSTGYTVTIKGGASGAKDLAGNAMASDYVWSWTTAAAADITPPTAVSINPANLATNVSVTSVVGITFSEAMDPLTITTANIKLAGPGVASVAGAISYAALTNIATFTPSLNLASSATYTARITIGVKDLAGNALATEMVWTFTTASGTGPAPVNLGTAGNFVILAKAGISTTGTTAVTGNIGLSPAAASFITGFSLIADGTNVFSTSSLVTGQIFAADYAVPTPTNLTTAVLDMMTAYTDAAGRAPDVTELGAGNIGGMTLTAGVYKWGTGVIIPTDITLSGSPTDVWIFEIAQDLVMSSATQIHLAGGALAKNIFWQVFGIVDLGTTAHFEGIALVQTAITLRTGATVNGRLLAQTAITLDASTVVQPAP